VSTGQPHGKEPEPRLKPTSAATLVVAALAAAAVAWLSVSHWFFDIMRLPWLPAATLLALAVVEFVLAQQTRARIERKPGRPPVEPLAVARYVVLAKASSLAGAIFAGFTLALTLWLVIEAQRLDHAARGLPIAALSAGASLALVAAALWLERACRVPEDPGSDNKDQR
jgi:apolipoprotein N-acyltransferase